MTHTLKGTGRNAGTLIAICLSGALFMMACKKNKNDEKANLKFVGSWHGMVTCNIMGTTTAGDTGTVVLTAGATDNMLTTIQVIGADSTCLKTEILTITANGQNLVIPSQTYTDLCGNSYTFTGNGSLSGTTLTLTQAISFPVSGIPLSATCTITATK